MLLVAEANRCVWAQRTDGNAHGTRHRQTWPHHVWLTCWQLRVWIACADSVTGAAVGTGQRTT